MCVTNHTSETLTVVAARRDGAGIVLAQRVQPDGTAVARWPWISDGGQLLAGPYGSGAFNPWSADSWRWTIGGALTPGGCP